MRHHSQRVPGKNYPPTGRQTALPAHHRDHSDGLSRDYRIVVDTDSEPIMAGIRTDFPQVIVLERPKTCAPTTFP